MSLFGFGHSGTSTSVDPDIERTPPPPATIVYFPQNDLNLPAAEDFFHRPGGPPDLYAAYCHIAKPSDVTLQHLAALNITVQDDVSPEDLMPASSDGLQHLPPRCWGAGGVLAPPRRQSSSAYEIYAHNTYPLLSNGTKAPDLETFQKFASELICDTDAGLRVIGKQKPKPGQKLPHFNTYRKFWTHLETLSSYWWTAEDVYVEVDSNAAHGKGLMSKLGRRASVDAGKGHKTLRYRGRRLHSGAKMPDPFRNDCIRAFVEPLVHAFGCGMASPRRLPQLQIKSLLIPVTQTAVIWRVPQDKAQAKRGVLEGPVIGIQCRSETAFMRDPIVALLDTAREMAGVILVGQERAREGKQDVSPGAGQWYTTKPRWGGGPGGEFGEFEGNKELGSHSHGRKPVVSTKYRPSEEDIWKELKPAPGPFEAHMTYLAVGKERMSEVDSAFMISSLYHHIAIVKLEVHPLYLEYLSTGLVPQGNPNPAWYAPKIQRTRWYDLFVSEDRAEALRCLWGVFSYSMRTGLQSEPLGQRQKSEISHAFPFRKKKYDIPDTKGPSRSHSVA